MMSTFPPVPPAEGTPRRSSNIWVWVVVVLVGICAICVVGGFFLARAGIGTVREMTGCMSSYQYGYDALRAYAEEHDGMLPPAETWQDDIAPYYERLRDKLEQEIDAEGAGFFFDAPHASDEWDCTMQGVTTTVTYNAAIGGKDFEELEPDAVLLFEGENAGRNAHLDYETVKDETFQSIFGERQVVTADGEWDGNGSMDADIDTDWRDALENPPAEEPPAEDPPAEGEVNP